jgi:hypothetical protein
MPTTAQMKRDPYGTKVSESNYRALPSNSRGGLGSLLLAHLAAIEDPEALAQTLLGFYRTLDT